MFGAGIAVFLLLGLTESTSADTASQIGEPALWAFFAAGAIAICAMILPGISGSFILVILGMYAAVLAAVGAGRRERRGRDRYGTHLEEG